ncbi:CDT1 Geminin-binding domain-like [Trinorchestia longiramus]|nr:CDT1 Geminin-binding domain-like [Trinorchestia longiramus]
MTSTQATLNDYFKAKRCVRGLSDENGKPTKTSTQIEGNSAKYTPDSSVISIQGKAQQSDLPVVTLPLHSEQKATRELRRASRIKKPVVITSSETIENAFYRATKKNLIVQRSSTNLQVGTTNAASTKRKRACVKDDKKESDTTAVASAAEKQINSCSTPKHDTSTDVSQPCKRLRAEVQGAEGTPDKAGLVAVARNSACKKLVMTGDADEIRAEKVSEEGKLQLNKCKKLSELRAQLLKMRQCETKLVEFRSSVLEPAQREAQQASAFVAKVVGNVPSPRKSGSPLKMVSPRKMFSPHNDLSSPYKCVSSPRLKSVNPLLEHFTSLEVEVPISPVKTPTKSPGKELTAVPAYERYSHLVQDASRASSSGLALPYSYRMLREVFRAVDTVVSLMHNRQEVITFDKLKPAVQQMLRRTFLERNLGQLSRVFPLAYFFRQDKVRAEPSVPGKDHSNYQLTISANLNYNDNQRASPDPGNRDSPTPCRKLFSSFGSSATSDDNSCSQHTRETKKNSEPSFRKMDSLVLVERRSIFHQSLVNIIHQHHLKFLKSLEPSLAVADVSCIKRWHPQFPLDELPEVEPVTLPQTPSSDSLSTAAHVLNVARGLLNKNPRLEATVIRAAESLQPQASAPPVGRSTEMLELKNPSSASALHKSTQSTPQKKDVALALKGISVSLLQKIRAREAAAASRAMVRSAADTRGLEVLSRLPERGNSFAKPASTGKSSGTIQ